MGAYNSFFSLSTITDMWTVLPDAAQYTTCTSVVIQNKQYWLKLGCTDGTSQAIAVNIYSQLKDQKHSAHGLEHWTIKEGMRKRIRRNRLQAVDVVLFDQAAYLEDGARDFSAITELYRGQTCHSQMVASTKGLVNEHEALE